MAPITSDDLRNLLELFSSSCFKPKDSDRRAEVVMNKCYELMVCDYENLITINNENGELSSSYPSKILIPQKMETDGGKNANPVDPIKLRDLMVSGRIARCRARFPVPVILFDNKYVCRSATLASWPEIYGRKGMDLLFTTSEDAINKGESPPNQSLSSLSSLSTSDTSKVFSAVRSHDIKLLKYLSVGTISDLMVEKKKVKFLFNITSSEKADKECRYSDFRILSLPYPGCEFFKVYRDNDYYAEGLIYDWKQHFNDADLEIPEDELSRQIGISWSSYKNWDIIKLTQNYLKLLLFTLNNYNSALLVHCISGWDRTPLFISLLRLSLWADGLIHQKLSALEVTYLTVAYDWFLFGHNLSDRISKGEEILFFCFYFLKFITSEEFTINVLRATTTKSNACERESNPSSESVHLDPLKNIKGSCSSLNSNSSCGSSKSQDNCPPIFFPCNSDSLSSLNIKDSDDYATTPPTLTNSEENANFLNDGPVKLSDEKFDGSSTEFPLFTVVNSRTTPVEIPIAVNKIRKVSEGSNFSLNRSDSWQLVSDTGSIRDYSSMKGPLNCTPESGGSNGSYRNCDANEETNSLKEKSHLSETYGQYRRERLQEVRSIFYNCYSSVVGFRFNNGTDAHVSGNSGPFSTFLDHLAGRVAAP